MKTLKVSRRHQFLFASIAIISMSAGIFHFETGQFRKQNYPEQTENPAYVQQGQNLPRDIGQAEPNQTGKTQQADQQTVNPTEKIFYQDKVAVLTYHHLDPAESSMTISPERFKSHLEALKNNGFHVISMEDFVDFLQKNKSVPPNAVVITFDDGYESVYQYAYPMLKSEGMTATVFVIVGYIEDGTVRKPPILNWKEIMEMHKDGFSFYSHTFNSHKSVALKGKKLSPLLAKLYHPSAHRPENESEYKARIRNDFIQANNILNAKLGNKINLLCLPHGQFNQTVIDIANQSGIPFLFTGIEGFNTVKDKLIKRINAGSPQVSDKLLIAKLSLSGRP